MDLLDFEGQELYFDEPMPVPVSELLEQAAAHYTEGSAELPLLRAYLLASDNLAVLVALYRFFFYQHRYEETLVVAHQALKVSGQRLNFPEDWHQLQPEQVNEQSSVTLVRFYLLALKGAAYVNLRLNRIEEGRKMLYKVMALDPADRLGASILLAAINEQMMPENP